MNKMIPRCIRDLKKYDWERTEIFKRDTESNKNQGSESSQSEKHRREYPSEQDRGDSRRIRLRQVVARAGRSIRGGIKAVS